MSISSIGSSYAVTGPYQSLIGSSNRPASVSSAREDFLKYAAMTPAEKMHAAMLAKLGVTEEELKAMSPEKRKEIEDKLKEMIKQQVQNDPENKNKTGQIADLLA
jgi:hypothetical protein